MPVNNHLVIIACMGKGFGRSLAVAFSRALLCNLHFIFVGQSDEELRKTAEFVSEIRPTTVTSDIIVADLTKQEDVLEVAGKLFETRDFSVYTHVTFVNNAQTVQPIRTIATGMDMNLLTTAVQLNVTSPMYLTSECMRALKDPSRAPPRAAVVNISSLWATEAAASFGVFSASKAAMEMFYEVLAEETHHHSSLPDTMVLNYSPGPLDTSLQTEIRESPYSDPHWQQSCCQMKKDGTLIHPDKSARKLALLVIQELYETGDHIDYYDQIEGVDYPRTVKTTCCSNPNCQCDRNCHCLSDGPQCGGCASFMLNNR